MRLVCLAVALTAVALVPVGRAHPEDLSKDDQEWLALVAPLIRPSERELYEQLDKKDRDEFKKIFWARRDDDPEMPKAENAFRTGYMERIEEADHSFQAGRGNGRDTDCGRVLLVLGLPAERKGVALGVRPGTRPVQSWTYRGEMFADGETSVTFGPNCELPRDRREAFLAQLDEVAEQLVRRPALDYKLDDDGRLVKLEDRLPKPNKAVDLLKAPRQDFAMETETKLIMRGQQGATYVAGMLRGDASELEVRDEQGRRVADLIIAVEAVGADGSVPQTNTLELLADVDDAGQFIASWPLTLPGGQYTARIAAVDAKSGKGSVTNLIFEAPDYASGELGWSPLLLVAEMRQTAEGESNGAYAALTLGTNQLVARYGNTFTPADQLQLIAFLYNAAIDPATGKAALSTSFEISDGDGKLLSKSGEQVFDTEQSVTGVGPVPLTSFAPGNYSVEMKLNDTVAGKQEAVRAEFTVLGPGGEEAPKTEGSTSP